MSIAALITLTLAERLAELDKMSGGRRRICVQAVEVDGWVTK